MPRRDIDLVELWSMDADEADDEDAAAYLLELEADYTLCDN